MLRLAALALVLLTSACATQGRGLTTRPLAHHGDEPLQFTALGAKYAVPARLTINDHDKQPGKAWLDFVDANNDCRGGVVFTASGDRKQAQRHLEDLVNRDLAQYREHGVESQVQPTTRPLLGEKAEVYTAQLSKKDERAAKGFFGVYLSEQQLFVMGFVFCKQPGFLESTLRVVTDVVGSQQLVSATQVVAR